MCRLLQAINKKIDSLVFLLAVSLHPKIWGWSIWMVTFYACCNVQGLVTGKDHQQFVPAFLCLINKVSIEFFLPVIIVIILDVLVTNPITKLY